MDNESLIIKAITPELPSLESIAKMVAVTDDVKSLVNIEMQYLSAIALGRQDIQECSPHSIVLGMRYILKNNLSFDPQAGLVYVMTRAVNTGTKKDPQWVKVLEVQPTANGHISIARQCGRILDIKRPTVEYNQDGAVVSVTVEFLVPSSPSNRWESVTFGKGHFLKWQRASHKQNSRNKSDANYELLNYANPNYTNFMGGIDPEFASAKAIKHALGNRLGTNPNEDLRS